MLSLMSPRSIYIHWLLEYCLYRAFNIDSDNVFNLSQRHNYVSTIILSGHLNYTYTGLVAIVGNTLHHNYFQV